MTLIKDKTAMVTGAASGIGAVIARKFAESGAKQIAVVDINLEGAKSLAGRIEKEFACEVIPIKASVDNIDDVKMCFETVKKHMKSLDILVNNAGISDLISIDDITMEHWDRTFDINVKGSFLFAREAINMMKPKKYGRIVNMGSQAGKIGGLIVGMDYSSSKGAILTLTKSLAKVCAPYNITVNSVAPGLISTAMTETFGYDPKTVPLGRIGTPEEVADVVLFAASDLSRYITGACFDVNGGMSMW